MNLTTVNRDTKILTYFMIKTPRELETFFKKHGDYEEFR